jgi:hypothetical protein
MAEQLHLFQLSAYQYFVDTGARDIIADGTTAVSDRVKPRSKLGRQKSIRLLIRRQQSTVIC